MLALRDVAKSSTRRPRRGIRITDDELQGIAAKYREAVRVVWPPPRCSQGKLNVGRSTVSRWIRRARDRG